MANEPKSNSGEWQMPEPIFRSSEGRTPKSARPDDHADEVDTLSPDFAEADTDEIDVDGSVPDQDEIDTETPDNTPELKTSPPPVYEERPPERTAVHAATEKQTGGCAKTMTMILGTIALSVIVIIIVLVYYGFYYQAADRTF
jgi:hypothetical protein